MKKWTMKDLRLSAKFMALSVTGDVCYFGGSSRFRRLENLCATRNWSTLFFRSCSNLVSQSSSNLFSFSCFLTLPIFALFVTCKKRFNLFSFWRSLNELRSNSERVSFDFFVICCARRAERRGSWSDPLLLTRIRSARSIHIYSRPVTRIYEVGHVVSTWQASSALLTAPCAPKTLFSCGHSTPSCDFSWARWPSARASAATCYTAALWVLYFASS